MDLKKEIEGITKWIKKYVEASPADGVIIGLSGGADSTLVAKLCVDALGKKNVYGAIMPCESQEDDIEDGKMVRDWLDIGGRVFNLEHALEGMKVSISVLRLKPMTLANIKARLRMITLYAISSELGRLVVGTGNKSEHEVGYFTKYGDGGTDLEPIMSFYKTEVWEMLRILEAPQKIIDRVPSAGLWDGQTDEGELGVSYQQLDAYLIAGEKNHCTDLTNSARIEELKAGAKHKQSMPPYYKRGE